MKKLLAIILAAIMVFSFTACGGGSSSAKGSKGTGLWKVTYPDGRIAYYDIFENGSEKLSVRPVTAAGSENLLSEFGDDNFDYLADMGFIGQDDSGYFSEIIYDYYNYYATGDFKAEIKAEAERINKSGTEEQKKAFGAFIYDIDRNTYKYNCNSYPGEIRMAASSHLLITADFNEKFVDTNHGEHNSFEGDANGFTMTQGYNEPFSQGAVWEKTGDTTRNAAKLAIKDISKLNGNWKMESYDAKGNVVKVEYYKLYQDESNENVLKTAPITAEGESVGGVVSPSYNWHPEEKYFSYSGVYCTLSGDSDSLVVTGRDFLGFYEGSVLTRVK